MRTWFVPDYTKEGKGIAKDAPPVTGARLMLALFVQEFWQILKLNLLFVLCTLPVVTLGAARYALHTCLSRMVRDKPNDVGSDFKQALTQDTLQHMLLGAPEVLCTLACVALGLLALAQRSAAMLFVAVLLFSLSQVFWTYVWTMRCTIEIGWRQTLKNAVILMSLRPQHSLPVWGACTTVHGVLCLTLPLSLPFVLFVPFGICGYFASFAAWSGIQTYCIKKTEDIKHD